MAHVSWRSGLPLLLFAIAAGARLSADLTVDEAVFLTRSEIPLGDVVLFPYSPAYLFLLHLWSGVSGSVIWLRGLSLVLAFGALLLAPRVLRGLGGTHAAGGAFLILALSPFFVAQMVAVTPSALAALVVIVELLCFLEYLRAGQRHWLAGWMAAALLSLLVHGGLYYLVLCLCIGMAIYRHRYHGTRQRDWWLAQIAPLALFLLLSGAQFERFIRQRLQQLNTPEAAVEQWASLGSGSAGSWAMAAAVVLAALVLSGASACRDSKRDPRHGLLLLGAAIPVSAWLLWLPHDFYAVAALPFLAVLASMGLRLYPRWGRQLGWAALALVYGVGHWFG